MDGNRSSGTPKPVICEFLFHRNAEKFLTDAYRRLERAADQKSLAESTVQSQDRSAHQNGLCQETHA
jgi:hypothetical protein